MTTVESNPTSPALPSSHRARWARRVVILVSIVGITGMIVGSIADNNGTALTFGLIAAVAVGFLILLTAVVGRHGFDAAEPGGAGTSTRGSSPPVDERVAADLEARIQRLVSEGADEHEVRQLVTRSVELGRG